MITFDQSVNLTIHSKLSRYIAAKMSPFSLGKVRKGSVGIPSLSIKKYNEKSFQREEQEIQSRRRNQQRTARLDHIQFINSKIYPKIVFTLKENNSFQQLQRFPREHQQLQITDFRNHTLFLIACNLIMEIDFTLTELYLTVSQDKLQYNIYFYDSQISPFSRCCKYPIALVLHYSYGGYVVCLNDECESHMLFQFRLSIDEIEDLWQDNVSKRESSKDRNVRKTVSRMITTGKYRLVNLRKQITLSNNQIDQIDFSNLAQKSDFPDTGGKKQPRVNTAKLSELMELNKKLIGDDTIQSVDKDKLLWRTFDHRRSMSRDVATKANVFSKQFQIERTLQKF